MRIQVCWLAICRAEERFDLGAPFSFYVIYFNVQELFEQRSVLEEVPLLIRDGWDRFRRGDGIAHRENQVDAHSQLGSFSQCDGDVLCRRGNVHHAGGGCHHTAQVCFTDAARNLRRAPVIVGVDNESFHGFCLVSGGMLADIRSIYPNNCTGGSDEGTPSKYFA